MMLFFILISYQVTPGVNTRIDDIGVDFGVQVRLKYDLSTIFGVQV